MAGTRTAPPALSTACDARARAAPTARGARNRPCSRAGAGTTSSVRRGTAPASACQATTSSSAAAPPAALPSLTGEGGLWEQGRREGGGGGVCCLVASRSGLRWLVAALCAVPPSRTGATLAASEHVHQHLCLPAAVAWLPPTSRSRPHCSCSHPQRRLQCLHNRHGQVHQWRPVRAVRGGIPPWPSRLVPQGLRGCRGEKLALQTADGAPLVECPSQLPATFHPIHVAQLNPPCPSSDALLWFDALGFSSACRRRLFVFHALQTCGGNPLPRSGIPFPPYHAAPGATALILP